MIEWLSETFGLLFSGAEKIIIAILRLGVVAVAGSIAWLYIRAVIKDPVPIIRGTVGILAALTVGFGSLLVIPKYLPFEGALFATIVWVGGWVAAYYVAKIIIGFSDED